LLQACSLLAFFMHANRHLPPRRVHSPGDLSVGRVGWEVLVVSLVRRTKLLAFIRVVVWSCSSVSVVCRCWAASSISMARCAARRPLSSRYHFSSHASSAIITALHHTTLHRTAPHRTAHYRVGTAADSSSPVPAGSGWLAGWLAGPGRVAIAMPAARFVSLAIRAILA
jgi:hypothetical protein